MKHAFEKIPKNKIVCFADQHENNDHSAAIHADQTLETREEWLGPAYITRARILSF